MLISQPEVPEVIPNATASLLPRSSTGVIAIQRYTGSYYARLVEGHPKADFTDIQIRELKTYRKFILICDGYDECQQARNLYMGNRLNQPAEWNAKMIISCRSEYIGADYRDRFQPSDRNRRSEPGQFQEAVIAQDYIKQYVSLQRPIWETTATTFWLGIPKKSPPLCIHLKGVKSSQAVETIQRDCGMLKLGLASMS